MEEGEGYSGSLVEMLLIKSSDHPPLSLLTVSAGVADQAVEAAVLCEEGVVGNLYRGDEGDVEHTR